MSETYTKRFVGKREAINPEEHKMLSPVYATSKRLEANQRILMNLMGQLYTGGINQQTLQQLRDISLDLSDDSECLLNMVHDLYINSQGFPTEVPTTDTIAQLNAQIEMLKNQLRNNSTSKPIMRVLRDENTHSELYDNDVIETHNRVRVKGYVTRRSGRRVMSGVGERYVLPNGDMYRASCDEIKHNTPIKFGTLVFDIAGVKYTFVTMNRKGEMFVDDMTGKRKIADGSRMTSKMYLQPPFYISKEDAKQMRLV